MLRTALLTIILTGALTGCASSDSGDPGGGSVDVAGPSPAASAAASPAASKAAGGLSDGSFTSTAPQVKDAFGNFGGTARVTNTSDKEKTATFTYTVFKGDAQVATLVGVANAVGAGSPATVQLASTDKYVPGPYRVEFQVDAEF